MTREEFADYVWSGEQWTPATLVAARMAMEGMLPTCDAGAFEREATRADGVIEFKKMEPLFKCPNFDGIRIA